MAKTKWRAREYTPSENQQGSHSFYAEAVISTEIDNRDLAKKIQDRTGMRAYEAQAAIAAMAEIVAEELLESSRITITDTNGVKMVSFYPRVSGSISDADVQDNPQKYNGAQAATEDMLTPDMLTWNVGATVGVKYSRTFAQNKQAQKVKYVATDTAIPSEGEPDNTGDNTGGDQGGGSNGGGGTDENGDNEE